jgi:predicted transglutaminase-like cysteine proteinase
MRRVAAVFGACLMGAAGTASAGDLHLSSFATGQPPEGASALCRAFPGACHRGGGTGAGLRDDAAILAAAHGVNREVNRDISPGVIGSQSWRLIASGPGDCTNYVAAKKHRLLRAGVPADRLLAAVVRGDDAGLHAVLVLRLSTGDLVLDNLDDAIRPWSRTRYTFLKMQNPTDGSRWDVVLLGPRASRI